MRSLVLLLGSVSLLATSGLSAKEVSINALPSFVPRACKIGDPEGNKCFKDVANSVLHSLAKGDPKYNLPSLEPLYIKEIKINQGTKQIGIVVTCEGCFIDGLANSTFTDVNIDVNKQEFRWEMYLERMVIYGKYAVNGKILLVAIKGAGDGELIFENLKFNFVYKTKEEKKSSGFSYTTVTNMSLWFQPENVHIQLDSLFNGDKILGDKMNQFLNENWKEIFIELKPALYNFFGKLFADLINNISKLVPAEYLYQEK